MRIVLCGGLPRRGAKLPVWWRSTLWVAAGVWLGSVAAGLATNHSWNVDADGNWKVKSNWTPSNSVPDRGDTATFGAIVTAIRTITMTEERRPEKLVANSSFGYLIVNGGGGSLSLSPGTAGAVALTQSGSGQFKLAVNVELQRSMEWNGDGTGWVIVDAVISDDGGTDILTKSGTFKLALNGNNTFGDGFVLAAGTVAAGHNNALGTGGVTLNGGTVEANSSGISLGNAITVGGNFSVGGSNNLNLSGTMNLGADGRTITVNNTGLTTFSGVISGAASMTKAGSGSLQLSGANTFGGGLTLSAGKVILAHTSAAGTGSLSMASGTTVEATFTGASTIDTMTASGGRIERTVVSATPSRFLADSVSRTLTVNGSMVLEDSGNTAGGGLAVDGRIIVNNSGTTLTLDADGANSSVILGGSQKITLAAGAALATTGTGTVKIGEASARTVVGQGSGSLESTVALGASSHSLNALTGFEVNGSGTKGLTIQGSMSTLNSVLVTGSNIQNISGTGGTFTVEATGAGTLTVTKGAGVPTPVKIGFNAPNETDYTFNLGSSSDSGTVNVFQNWGGLVVKGGTVRLQQDQSFVSTAGHATTLELSGGKLVLGGDDLTFEGAITLTGGSLIGGDFGGQRGTLTGGGDVTLTGTTTSAFLPKAALAMNPSSGTKSLSRTGGAEGLFHSLTKTGAGNVSITDSFDFSLVNIESGTILLGANNVLVDNPAIVMKGGNLFTQGTDQSGLGTLTLTTSGIIDLGSGGSVINFASGSPSWSGGAQLTITSWQGSTSGGGTDQIYFGNSTSGLSAGNVSKILFKDPFGPGSGTFPARILPTGEVVPVPEPATVLSTLAVIAAVGYRERRRIAGLIARWRSSANPQV